MAKALDDAQWMALPTLFLGLMIFLNVVLSLPDPLAMAKLLLSIGLLTASYGLWTDRKWGGALAVAMCAVEFVELFLMLVSGVYTYSLVIGIIVCLTIPAILYFNVWKILK